MDHVVVPLGPAHTKAVAQLADDVVAATGPRADAATCPPAHVTLASFRGLAPAAAVAALQPVAAAVTPFTVRAHGYGIFAGDEACELSLHVMVVRTAGLDDLHRRVHDALVASGAEVEGVTSPPVWTPHITLLDRALTPDLLGQAVEHLAQRPHRTWTVDVGALLVTRRGKAHADPAPLPLTGSGPSASAPSVPSQPAAD